MPEKGRRLSDKIIDAFNMAYDKNDLEVAEGLYQILDTALPATAERMSTTGART